MGDCDSGKRPADVLIPSWSLNKDYAIDVAVTDPINGSFKLDLEACNKYAENYKHNKYDDGFKNTQIVFLPVVFSTFGSLNEEGSLFLKDLFRRNCDSLGQKRCTHMPFLWQKLSILLQNENFKMMSRRFKLSSELSTISNLTQNDIPEINQDQSEHLQDTIESQKLQNLDYFLKDILEESIQKEKSQILEVNNMDSNSFQQEDCKLSEWINEEAEEKERLDYITKSMIESPVEEESEIILNHTTKEDSNKYVESLPKIGDKVKVKYPDGWYIGRVL